MGNMDISRAQNQPCMCGTVAPDPEPRVFAHKRMSVVCCVQLQLESVVNVESLFGNIAA